MNNQAETPAETEPEKAEKGQEDNQGQENQEAPPQPRFRDFKLDERLQRAIDELGFEHCTGIQGEALPKTLKGLDLIGQAQTGTGKTAAFLISAIQRLLENPIPFEQRYASEPRVLALAPTRELAMQIARDAEALTRHSGHNVVTTVGGMNYDRQRRQIRNEAIDILVATPGRLLDFLGSKDVFLDQLDLLILDEADRMLDMGFIPDVKKIIRHCTPKSARQTVLFSATFNQDVLNLAAMWSENAEFIEIEPESKAAERVEQIFFTVSDSDKEMVLINFLQRDEVSRAIVFANRRDQTRDLEAKLRAHGVHSALLSGEIPQNKRISTLNRFKEGDVRVLVATDVAARGIHVEDVSHVFNFNLPDNPEDYVHRIGRTGRAGASGTSVTLAGEDDSFVLPDLENYLNQSLSFVRPPDPLMVPLPEPAKKAEPEHSEGGDGKPGRQRNRNRSQRREEDASG
ncbi:ATP-dependent RNA helicase RhlB [Halovibrio salipaludis]|uniref:ATP-dependent RNA helicase RhlB n=1 Tax=Halovibrio salipaludis TaxID=2032626 RepID=A0A2A2F9P0_9GAMM|nr:DEAD/DEAH box helicase [Halovibrio salipaludis]PAU81263.1 ATP-dependent RNA helicase RhlB [Halovibrio salipaludis]